MIFLSDTLDDRTLFPTANSASAPQQLTDLSRHTDPTGAGPDPTSDSGALPGRHGRQGPRRGGGRLVGPVSPQDAAPRVRALVPVPAAAHPYSLRLPPRVHSRPSNEGPRRREERSLNLRAHLWSALHTPHKCLSVSVPPRPRGGRFAPAPAPHV